MVTFEWPAGVRRGGGRFSPLGPRVVPASRRDGPRIRNVAPLTLSTAADGQRRRTVADGSVTEVTAGSGCSPTLFDGYRFSGRAGCAVGTAGNRRPGPDIVTVLGGGYIASGAAESTGYRDPNCLRAAPGGRGGCGEQTPVRGRAANRLRTATGCGMHAKAGEPCEHVDVLHLLAVTRSSRWSPPFRPIAARVGRLL